MLEDELSDLVSLYAAREETRTLSQIIILKLDTMQADQLSLCNTRVAVLKTLKEKIEKLGIDVSTNGGANVME
jgi:hypothetical protein